MPGLIATARQRTPCAPSRALGLFLSTIRRAAAAIRNAAQRSSQRRALREWVDHNEQHLLRDIGITRERAGREAEKWFWQR